MEKAPSLTGKPLLSRRTPCTGTIMGTIASATVAKVKTIATALSSLLALWMLKSARIIPSPPMY
jgi:hypothetical protein